MRGFLITYCLLQIILVVVLLFHGEELMSALIFLAFAPTAFLLWPFLNRAEGVLSKQMGVRAKFIFAIAIIFLIAPFVLRLSYESLDLSKETWRTIMAYSKDLLIILAACLTAAIIVTTLTIRRGSS